eukprot:g12862.t1
MLKIFENFRKHLTKRLLDRPKAPYQARSQQIFISSGTDYQLLTTSFITHLSKEANHKPGLFNVCAGAQSGMESAVLIGLLFILLVNANLAGLVCYNSLECLGGETYFNCRCTCNDEALFIYNIHCASCTPSLCAQYLQCEERNGIAAACEQHRSDCANVSFLDDGQCHNVSLPGSNNNKSYLFYSLSCNNQGNRWSGVYSTTSCEQELQQVDALDADCLGLRPLYGPPLSLSVTCPDVVDWLVIGISLGALLLLCATGYYCIRQTKLHRQALETRATLHGRPRTARTHLAKMVGPATSTSYRQIGPERPAASGTLGQAFQDSTDPKASLKGATGRRPEMFSDAYTILRMDEAK